MPEKRSGGRPDVPGPNGMPRPPGANLHANRIPKNDPSGLETHQYFSSAPAQAPGHPPKGGQEKGARAPARRFLSNGQPQLRSAEPPEFPKHLRAGQFTHSFQQNGR